MPRPESKDHARRQELISLVDSCDRDDYVSSDCPSALQPLGHQCDAFSELVACDAKIVRMEEELIKVHRSRVLLKEKVNRSHDKLLRKIPAEVVTQIFSFYVQLRLKTSRVHAILLTLARVSKAWRDLVFNTPQLWATITVHIDHGLLNDREPRVQALRLSLSRSAQAPLSVSLHFDRVIGGKLLVPHPLFEMVVACADRWNHLSVWLANNRLCETVVKDQKIPDLRQLKSLEVRVYDGIIGPHLKRFLQPMPCLEHFEITHMRSLSEIDVTWSALTRLEIHSIPGNLFLQVLGLAPALTQCEIGLAYVADELPRADQLASPIFVHSRLQRLHIQQSGNPSRESDFDMLVLPSLTDLHYQANNYISSDIRALKSMIIQSRCSIQRLSVSINGIPSASKGEVMGILDASHTVKYLIFDAIFTSKQEHSSLDLLAAENRGQLLPYLESFETTYSGPYDSAFARIANTFNPNSEPGDIAIMSQRPLRHVRIKFARAGRKKLLGLSSGDQNFLRLVQIKESGFDLELVDREGDDFLSSSEARSLESSRVKE